jgi:hypothetical protein
MAPLRQARPGMGPAQSGAKIGRGPTLENHGSRRMRLEASQLPEQRASGSRSTEPPGFLRASLHSQALSQKARERPAVGPVEPVAHRDDHGEHRDRDNE